MKTGNQLAEMINGKLGFSGCSWSEHSRCWTVEIPLDMPELAETVRRLFAKAGCRETLTRKTMDESGIEIRGFV